GTGTADRFNRRACQMATKHISGSYPAGYYLQPSFQNLIIDPTGVVGGTGVTTTAAQPSNIGNQGTVTTNGITLSDGGTIRNGSATNTTALISADTVPAITVSKASAVVTNFARIERTPPGGYDKNPNGRFDTSHVYGIALQA